MLLDCLAVARDGEKTKRAPRDLTNFHRIHTYMLVELFYHHRVKILSLRA